MVECYDDILTLRLASIWSCLPSQVRAEDEDDCELAMIEWRVTQKLDAQAQSQPQTSDDRPPMPVAVSSARLERHGSESRRMQSIKEKLLADAASHPQPNRNP